MSTNQPAGSTTMEMKQNMSTVDEGMSTTRLVTKSDGSQVPYSEAVLRAALNRQITGLNQDYLDIDIILSKVNSGLYNGK